MSAAVLLREAQQAASACSAAIVRASLAVGRGDVVRLLRAQAGNADAIGDALWNLRLVLDAELVRQQRENAYMPHQPERREAALPYDDRDQT